MKKMGLFFVILLVIASVVAEHGDKGSSGGSSKGSSSGSSGGSSSGSSGGSGSGSVGGSGAKPSKGVDVASAPPSSGSVAFGHSFVKATVKSTQQFPELSAAESAAKQAFFDAQHKADAAKGADKDAARAAADAAKQQWKDAKDALDAARQDAVTEKLHNLKRKSLNVNVKLNATQEMVASIHDAIETKKESNETAPNATKQMVADIHSAIAQKKSATGKVRESWPTDLTPTQAVWPSKAPKSVTTPMWKRTK